MNPSTQGDTAGAADTYVWQVPGKPVAVHIPLTIIDRLSVELMRGYGANPKRSPELGGVLIGSIEEGTPTIVRVQDFELVPCQYRRGPSYTFTEEDCGPFELAGTRTDGIGYFRSHTRDGLALGAEDIELLDHFFAGPHTVALLVKPFATKVSQAGIFIREDGTFPAVTPLEFPFRRQELMERRPRLRDLDPSSPRSRSRYQQEGAPGAAVAPDAIPGSAMPGSPVQSDPGQGNATPGNAGANAGAFPNGGPPYSAAQPSPVSQPGAQYNPATEPAIGLAPPLTKKRWMWLPLSFVFLLLGLGLGFQAALTYGSRPMNLTGTDFSLSLAVTRTDQTLTLRWDKQAPAVRAAKRGVLEIEEEGISKPVDLDAAQLQNGTLIYRNVSDDVRFKLSVFPQEGLSVSQSAEWRREQ
jgi:hypothetical protein